MIILIIRTLILYGAVIFSMRIMGKRQIGEFQPSEFVVAMMISDLASVPMQAIDIPLLSGIIPVFTLVVAEICLSFLASKSKVARSILSGKPSILVYDGKIDVEELKRLRFCVNDLLEELRTSNFNNILDVQVAVLETNGKLSIIPKADARAVTVQDLNLKNPRKEGMSAVIVSDGKFNKKELRRIGLCEYTAEKILKEHGVVKICDIFLAVIDVCGELYIQLNDGEVLEPKGM